MAILASLSTLALRPLLKSIGETVKVPVGEAAAEAVSAFLTSRFVDPSKKLPAALQRASNQAWRALEIALAGESLWGWLDRADNKAFREQVRAFLDSADPDLPRSAADQRQQCLRELQAARKAGVLVGGIEDEVAAEGVAGFLRFHNPGQLLEAEWQAIGAEAARLRRRGYGNLAAFLEQRPIGHGPPLLAVAVRFFFRVEVESDSQLFQGLAYEQLDRLDRQMQTGFAGVQAVIARQGKELALALESVQLLVRETHDAVLDVQGELRRQGRQYQELYEAVLGLHQKLDLAGREVRPHDSLSIRSDAERQAVKQLLAHYRKLPEEERRQLPALLNAVGKLEVAAGDFSAAGEDFAAVAALVDDRTAQGEAHFNRYQALLEQHRYDDALKELRAALACDPQRFALFPTDKYEPVRVLGVGGFGAAFHCKYRPTGGDVAIKVLLTHGLDRDVQTVFQEAGVLDKINHPAIVQLRECGYADEGRTRPYLVMSYFEGQTLASFVKTHGPLSLEEFLAIARPTAEALQAAHAKGILHRDVKPANLLVHPGGGRWQVKLIDFGLALKQSVFDSAASTSHGDHTVLAASIAGTMDYAAPEQMGKLPGVRVDKPADVYGFGKTCCYALFQTPAPLRKHWHEVPESLAALLEDCLHESPKARLANFTQVLKRLEAVRKRPLPPPLPPPLTVVPLATEVLEVRPIRRDAPPPVVYEADEPRRPRQRRRRGLLSARLHPLLGALAGALFLCGLTYAGDIMERNSPRLAMQELLITLGLVAAIGAFTGAIVRSVRGWLFVLAGGAAFAAWETSAGRAHPMPLPTCIAVGSLIALMLALPIKLVLFIVRRSLGRQ